MDAAAFASLRSLADMIRNIKFRNSKGVPPFFYRQQIDEFEVQVLDLQKYLEDLEPELRKKIEMEISISKIPDIVSTAKGTIDFHVVDQIIHLIKREQDDIGQHSEGEVGLWKGLYSLSHSLPCTERNCMISSFREALQPVMTDMKNIKEKLVEDSFILAARSKDALALGDSSSYIPVTSTNSGVIIPSSPVEGSKIVGFEERVDKLKEFLLYSHEKEVKVVALYGMGGIGKTTLARNVYDDPSIAGRFDKCIWFTVSQRCDVISILQGILDDKETKEIRDLGSKVYRLLKGKRYLIVMDDLWRVDDWDQLWMHLPKEREGSRIVVTTRELNVARSLCKSVTLLEIGFLNLDQSWKLLCEKAFGSNSSGCPSKDHEKIGREIAKGCKGLPLSIAVIAGLLSKSDMSIKFWKNVAENVSKLVTTEDHGRCLEILSFSYDNLPLHLKPCFLYMGSYKEDEAVSVDELTRKWICAGLLKPEGDKTMDDIAEKYMMELIDRNMLVGWKKYDDLISVRVHDLMLQLCVAELEKSQKLKNVIIDSSSNTWKGVACKQCQQIRDIYIYNRFGIDNIFGPHMFGDQMDLCMGIHQVRDLHIDVDEYGCTCGFSQPYAYNSEGEPSIVKLPLCRDRDYNNQLVCKLSNFSSLPLFLFWNTCFIFELNVSTRTIWDLALLQKWIVRTNAQFMIPNELVNPLMEKLQELSYYNVECTRELVECTPNLIYLNLNYDIYHLAPSRVKTKRLDNIQYWNKLEKLHISKVPLNIVNIMYPHSLIELIFRECDIYWHSEFTALPNLKRLILHQCNVGQKWSMRGVKFQNLEFLEIGDCNSEYKSEWRWKGKEENFPQLKFLVLKDEKALETLSTDMGGISTLHSIYIIDCCDRVVESAKQVIRNHRKEGYDAQLYINHKLYAFEGDDEEEDDDDDEEEEEEGGEEDLEGDEYGVIYDKELLNSNEESIRELVGFSPDVLILNSCSFNWNQEQLGATTFSHLKRLTLSNCGFGSEWNAEKIEFLQLQHLVITSRIPNPKWKWKWKCKASHFPQLQSLSINDGSLLMIPLYMSNIPSLVRIRLGKYCSKGVGESAKVIFLKKKDTLRLTIGETDYKEGDKEDWENVEEYKLDVIYMKELWNSNEESIRGLLGFYPDALVFEGGCFNWNQEQVVTTTFTHLKRLILIKCKLAREWNVERVEFLQLQYLYIDRCFELEWEWEWKGKASNFPKLRSLLIRGAYLKAIPLDMSKITGLVRICLVWCLEGVKESARIIFKLKEKDTLRLTIDETDYKTYEEEEEDDVEEYKFNVTYDKELWNTNEESIRGLLGFSPNVLVLCRCSFNWNQYQLVPTTFSCLKRLNLSGCRFAPEWNVERVEFLHLQHLNFSNDSDSPWEWKGKASNFPKLRSLLIGDRYLKEIPLDMSNITTLVRIHLHWCSKGVEESAKTIFESKEKGALRLTINNIDYKEEVEDGEEIGEVVEEEKEEKERGQEERKKDEEEEELDEEEEV